MDDATKVMLLTLSAGLVAVVAVPVVATHAADGGLDGIRPSMAFKQDIAEWVRDESEDKKSQEELIEEISAKYSAPFRDVIEGIRVATGVRDLSEDEILGAIDYIVIEGIKEEKRKFAREQAAIDNAYVEEFGHPDP